MNQMEIFKNPEFGSIRTFEQGGKVLFCGTDVATALGYANPRKAVRDHTRCGTKCSIGVQTGKKADGSPAVQMVEMLFIPEGDVYRLIVHSKLPSAERFERWVFDEVLPSIRQHGAYLTREKLWEVATSPEALLKLCSDLLAEREKNAALQADNARLQGKAVYYTCEAMRLFLLGAISRAFRPGCKFEIMLCLVGGQGAGKSSFFRLLAVQDDWFSDDLKKLDDENVYRKMQGHWLIEMSEMIATANAKSIEEIKSFLSRQKETYKVPYETHPADRKRQCVFCGTSNTLDFLPLDRTGNRRFVPVMVHPELAEIHILDDEPAARAYLIQVWAEAMEIYRSGNFKLRFSPAMNEYLKVHQRDFMPEDTKAGQIIEYLEKCSDNMVCSKQLFREALGHSFDEPKQWEIREINDIMNNSVTGWRAFSNPRYFRSPYGRQKGWERIQPDNGCGDFQELTPEEVKQLELPPEWLK